MSDTGDDAAWPPQLKIGREVGNVAVRSLGERSGGGVAAAPIGIQVKAGTSMFKVGLAEQLFNTRYSPTALVRASYLTAVATRVDSFWLPDHLNSLLPRSVVTPKYVGGAKLAPKIDALLEPWTVLGPEIASGGCGLVSG